MASTELKRLAAEEYTVGWVCAVHPELVAAKVFLDETHAGLEQVSKHDSNSYTLGRIGRHNVVVLVLSNIGTVAAATAVRNMAHTFPEIRFALMVGAGGGAPAKRNDIRLGDVVVSLPGDQHGGVVQWDFGKNTQAHGFRRTGFLDQCPAALQTAIRDLRADHEIEGHGLEEAVEQVLQANPILRKTYKRPDTETDKLFTSDFVHGEEYSDCSHCSSAKAHVLGRPNRDESEQTEVHYGLVASGNTVVKNALLRDSLANELGVLCFEMEAAGIMSHFPCLVIRGICNYSDSHKNKQWQAYAAMIAAAYAKKALLKVVPIATQRKRKGVEVLNEVVTSVTEVATIAQNIHTRQRNDIDRRILDRITAIDYGAEHSDHLSRRREDSGLWLLQAEEFESCFS